jgi:hypothetical protein
MILLCDTFRIFFAPSLIFTDSLSSLYTSFTNAVAGIGLQGDRPVKITPNKYKDCGLKP